MNLLKKLTLLTVFALALVSTASAQQLKIGYVDYESIIPNMPEYSNVMRKLQQEFQGTQGELQQLDQEMQTKYADYEKKKSLMNEQQRQAREQELMQMAQNFQQVRAQKEEQFTARQAELMQPLEKKLVDAINAIAEEKQLDLVLRPQAGMEPLIVYASDRIANITLDVARRLGIDVKADATNGR